MGNYMLRFACSFVYEMAARCGPPHDAETSVSLQLGEAMATQYKSLLGRKLWATLCEIEPGLFSVRYRCNVADGSVHDMPVYQVATCIAEAEQRIENRARTCGFDAVMWDHGLVSPTASFSVSEATRQSKTGTPLVAGD
jgi:hypothetical protein